MSWFSSAFKAVGNAVSSAAKGVVKASQFSTKFFTTNGLTALSSLPVLGAVATPLAQSIAEKVIPGMAPQVQQEATEQILQFVATPPATPEVAVAAASQVKQNLLASGVPPDQASAIGAVAHGLAVSPTPSKSLAALSNIDQSIPPAGVNNLTKAEVKVIVDGAVKGAKDGAVDAFLDKTDAGQATKRDAVESQGSKMLPWIFGIALAVMFFKNKRR